jgi:hypothetical protein
MRYWWANQNQTYGHEVPGGYLWSPKRKSNGGMRIPRDGEQSFHGIVNTDSTAT